MAQSLPDHPHHRVIILANPTKPQVAKALQTLRPWLAKRSHIVAEPDIRQLNRQTVGTLLPPADLAIVLGGDGTLLSQARQLVDLNIPMLGVNFGKVGFLAEFFLQDVIDHWDAIAAGKCRISQRIMLDCQVYAQGAPEWGDSDVPMPQPIFHAVAMNDAVITAGPPYRMVELELAIEPETTRSSATTIAGDGVIVATPSGSTAYNLSAGGPIVSPGLEALCISAIAPQSIAFRPIVFNASSDVWFTVLRANAGTELVLDGQESCRLEAGQQVLVKKHERTLRLVHNPSLNYWALVSKKMHWAARPSQA